MSQHPAPSQAAERIDPQELAYLQALNAKLQSHIEFLHYKYQIQGGTQGINIATGEILRNMPVAVNGSANN